MLFTASKVSISREGGLIRSLISGRETFNLHRNLPAFNIVAEYSYVLQLISKAAVRREKFPSLKHQLPDWLNTNPLVPRGRFKIPKCRRRHQGTFSLSKGLAKKRKESKSMISAPKSPGPPRAELPSSAPWGCCGRGRGHAPLILTARPLQHG